MDKDTLDLLENRIKTPKQYYLKMLNSPLSPILGAGLTSIHTNKQLGLLIKEGKKDEVDELTRKEYERRVENVKSLLEKFLKSLSNDDTYPTVWEKFKEQVLSDLFYIKDKSPWEIATNQEIAFKATQFILCSKDMIDSFGDENEQERIDTQSD